MKHSDYVAMGPKYAAGLLRAEGQGVESNPYPYQTQDHVDFIVEFNKLEVEELRSGL